MKDLYIIGAGGFGREVAWLVERINQVEKTWTIKGFIDDNKALHGTYEGGYPVLGGCEYLKDLTENTAVVCAVGSARIRSLIIDKLKDDKQIEFVTLIDPSVQMSERVKIGVGSIICAGTLLTVDIQVGEHVILNLDCTVGHDAVLEDFVTVYPGVHISGNVRVEKEVELGTGTQIIQGKRIGRESIIGAGAVVIRDIPEKCTAVGNPARVIK